MMDDSSNQSALLIWLRDEGSLPLQAVFENEGGGVTAGRC